MLIITVILSKKIDNLSIKWYIYKCEGDMMNKVITECPVCQKKLKITRLNCDKCDTTIESDFELSGIQQLNKEQLRFVETFIICRGNIKDVEKTLGISYPTVRARLDEIIDNLLRKEDSTERLLNMFKDID